MTNSRQKYRNPPVVEALCEIFFVGSEWDDTVLGRYYDRIKNEFPKKQQQEIHEAEVSFTPTGVTAAGVRRLPLRIQFRSDRNNRLIQLGHDLLVVNQLQPYPHFEDWEPSIHSALNIYKELAQPKGISKIGMRYINKVVIPKSEIRMEDYFTVYPHIPANMGDKHGAFMMRFELPSQKGGHSIFVTFGSAGASKVNEIAHVLDLYDIFQPAEPFSLEKIQNEIKVAHDNIETAFEGSITNQLRVLLGQENKP